MSRTFWGAGGGGGGGGGPLQENEDGTAIIPVDTEDSFIVGSDRKAQDTADTTKDKRTFYDKVKGAFRTGIARGAHWDDVNVGFYSHAEGLDNTASGHRSHAEGEGTTASAADAHSEGDSTTASGLASHAEGDFTTASGQGAHAEGLASDASGSGAHAEGNRTEATGIYGSHAEGSNTLASGPHGSHAEGASSKATGHASHARGSGAIASRFAQTAVSGGFLWNLGDCQANLFVPKGQTIDAAPVPLVTGNGTSSTPDLTGNSINVLTLLPNRVHRFRVDVAARRHDVSGEAAGWEFSGLIARGSTGNAYFVGVVDEQAWNSVDAAAWDVTLSINTTNATYNYLEILATGEAGKTIRWVAALHTVEVG